jgi:hypothetical protein
VAVEGERWRGGDRRRGREMTWMVMGAMWEEGCDGGKSSGSSSLRAFGIVV